MDQSMVMKGNRCGGHERNLRHCLSERVGRRHLLEGRYRDALEKT